MDVELRDILFVVIEQRNDALNKVAELSAQVKAMQNKIIALETSEEPTEEVVDK
jgi:hypothetical protein